MHARIAWLPHDLSSALTTVSLPTGIRISSGKLLDRLKTASLDPNLVGSEPLNALIAKYAKPGFTIEKLQKHLSIVPFERFEKESDNSLSRLSLSTSSGTEIRFSSCCDGSHGLALLHKGVPQAVISFNAGLDGKTVLIVQIQGVLGRERKLADPLFSSPKSSRGLMGINWPHLLVELVESCARGVGAEVLAIQSVKNNEWVKPYWPTDPPHLESSRGRELYDKVAIERGYTQAMSGNYFKSLTAHSS